MNHQAERKEEEVASERVYVWSDIRHSRRRKNGENGEIELGCGVKCVWERMRNCIRCWNGVGGRRMQIRMKSFKFYLEAPPDGSLVRRVFPFAICQRQSRDKSEKWIFQCEGCRLDSCHQDVLHLFTASATFLSPTLLLFIQTFVRLANPLGAVRQEWKFLLPRPCECGCVMIDGTTSSFDSIISVFVSSQLAATSAE